MSYAAANIDLVSLIEQKAGISLTPRAKHRVFGPEFWGPCPFCHAGDDRFHAWPEGDRPHYWCRVCNKEGSLPWFLVEYCGMHFGEACQKFGLHQDDMTGYQPQSLSEQLAKCQPPSKKWQEAGKQIVELAQHALWNSQQGLEIIKYLTDRGIYEEMIEQARLGYMPTRKDGTWHMESFEAWGIDPEKLRDDQRARGGVRVPNGIIIPWFEGDVLWKIAIKRPGEKMDYGQVLGSGEGMYGIDTVIPGRPVMMVEGEIDALSVMQEASDLIAVVATGSTTRGRLVRWETQLVLADYMLQSFDTDGAGEEGAKYWLDIHEKSLRWATMLWKDTNELLKSQPNGICTLRQWVQYGMEAAQIEFAHTAPSTLARETEELPVVTVQNQPDYQNAIRTQAEYERLCNCDWVETPKGPGQVWDKNQLRSHIERNRVRVVLESKKGDPGGETELFLSEELEPTLEIEPL